MSKYTIELRHLFDFFSREQVEGWFKDYNLEDYLTYDQIDVIESAGVWSKEKLAKKIVDHYFMREIGFETPALFRHFVKVEMQEIMEEKLPLIYSASIQYDPLINVDYVEKYERQIDDTANKNITNTQNGSDSTSQNSSGLTVASDTPQGEITKANILAGKYASNTSAGESTNASQSQMQSTGKSTEGSTTSSTEGSTKTVRGNSGVSATAQKMVQQYRENIIAIDRDIINELNDLFMNLW